MIAGQLRNRRTAQKSDGDSGQFGTFGVQDGDDQCAIRGRGVGHHGEVARAPNGRSRDQRLR